MATATQGRELGQKEVERLRERLNAWLNPRGYEAAPFLMGWYNSMLDQEHYVLPHEASTLGFSILSWSPMFEKALLPAYLDMSEQERLEPVNSTSKRILQSLRDQVLLALSESQSESKPEVEIVFDFDFVGRRPKLIVQVMGHVSGQAYYYQKLDVRNPGTWRQGDSSHVYGCSIHPRYGGWFGFRGALILKGVTAPSLPRVSPQDVVPEDEARMRLLDLFNRWDPGWRSVIPVAESDRYSSILQEFFDTPPTDRLPIIQRALQHFNLPSLRDPSPS